ncbi:MAG: T9SS type A sorting domain-containing protein [Bacteroidales bacterium]|jgi:hypothetical protein|nr:T9SS type A sorting domain-containing protein [Bacteroidales bacterium]
MRKLFLALALILFPAHVSLISAQKIIKNSSVTGVSLAGKKVNRIYIPPRDISARKGVAAKGGNIDVNYVGFTSQARAATEYAVSILEGILPAGTRITIDASWARISTEGVLGSTGITGYVAGWSIDALDPMAVYPLSIAEKIAGESLNPDSEGDVRLTLNSAIDWYFGTDGNTPTSKYDLVTVVLHELIHGLGFFNSMNISGTLGSYGFSGVPFVFDTFVENLNGDRLTDTAKFRNNSSALVSQITGGRLFFDGPVLSKYTSGGRARLYAPSSWSPGSSVSHLDEDQTLKLDALMTPFIDYGEAIHDPGSITEAILGDLGWIDTRITHKPLRDTEENLTQVDLSVSIRSDTSYNRNEVAIVYSFDNFKTEKRSFMLPGASAGSFRTTIQLPAYNTGLEYYFAVNDYFGRTYRLPALYNIVRFSFFVGTDTVKPLIGHSPGEYLLETVDSVMLEASVFDNIGIDTVYAEYMINTGSARYAGFRRISGAAFSASFNVKSLALKGGDSLRYRIVAIDSSLAGNVATFPSAGYVSLDIEEIRDPVESYATNFSAAEQDFFNSGFSMTVPKDFTSKALHTVHPYASPEDNDESINYVSLLRYPVLFGESGLLFRFREIVLVEPGEDGYQFGTEEFYDYVVIEGSKDFGKTWTAFIDGYDSRIDPLWESLYNNSIDGNNSSFVPTESQLKDRNFYVAPSSVFASGDTLLIRFRLFSDPFANGWGWVIEDLKINPLIDSSEELTRGTFAVFPNPGKGLINIRIDDSNVSRPWKYAVISSTGITLRTGSIAGESESQIDISGLPDGLYFITLTDGFSYRSARYSLIR